MCLRGHTNTRINRNNVLFTFSEHGGVKKSGYIWNFNPRLILTTITSKLEADKHTPPPNDETRHVSIFYADICSRGVMFFPLVFHLKYLDFFFLFKLTNQGHHGAIYHLFTSELPPRRPPTEVQPGNSANTPSRRGASIRASIIPFCDLQNCFFIKPLTQTANDSWWM